MLNVEVLLVGALSSAAGLPGAYGDIPEDRPPSFITVERVGGGPTDVRDLPLVAVQCWAPSRLAASDLATDVAGVLRGLALTHPQVASVNIQSVVNFPDLDSGHPRYQVTASLVTKK